MELEQTLPRPLKPEGALFDVNELVAKRYGTYEMARVWGAEQTFEKSLYVQGRAVVVLSWLHPEIVPPEYATEIAEKASLKYVSPERIRELEAKTGHDVIAINTALEEHVSRAAAAHINKLKTSADTTQPARALQIKEALEILAGSLENLRDIVLEKAVVWRNVPHMDCTHGYDALPTVAGRPLAYHAEMIQSNLDVLHFFYDYSTRGKWADATGNHHSAASMGIDGIALQEAYCKDLGIRWMTAPTQVPGLEFEADIFYVLSRTAATLDNLARYIAWGRSDDVHIFVNVAPQKKKGSSAMPHKDIHGGNPTTEEQTASIENYAAGLMTTALANCEMPYARTLYASANSRINFEGGFKFLDHGIRNLASTMYWLGLREERCRERVLRSSGVVTAQQVMTYLTDARKTTSPLPRSEAHELTARLATEAFTTQTHFVNVLLQSPEITSRFDEETIHAMSNPLHYTGESQRIIGLIAEQCYRKKTL